VLERTAIATVTVLTGLTLPVLIDYYATLIPTLTVVVVLAALAPALEVL
jgi:hypothetical protein